MSDLPLYLVDAFTDRPFAGNPAGVCLADRSLPNDWMQSLAMEMNQAETAFVGAPAADGSRPLWWFTPAVEVDLCGHATLASAHALWESGAARPDKMIRFTTRSGILTATRTADGIELDFPITPATPALPPPGLLEAVGVSSAVIGRTRFDYLLEVATATEVRAAFPDFRKLAGVESRGVILTAPSDDPRFDFISRFFAPAAGIDEDPVTGSAHCCLADYWGRKLGKGVMVGFQASRRGGVVRVAVTGERVKLCGRAVTVVRGAVAEPK